MKLYIYDHCPFCVKARMIFGLKNLPVELIVMLNDDEETPKRLIGQKIAPILQKRMAAACRKASILCVLSISWMANRC